MVFVAIRCLLASPYEPQTIEESQPSQLTIQISQQSTQLSIYPPTAPNLTPPNTDPTPPTHYRKPTPNRNKSGTLKATPMRSKPKRKAYSAPKTPKMRKDVKATWQLPGGNAAGLAIWEVSWSYSSYKSRDPKLQQRNQPTTPPAWTIPTQNFRWQPYFFLPASRNLRGRPLDKGDIVTSMHSPPKWERKMADPEIFCISNYQFKSVFWDKLHCIMSAEVMRFLRMPKSSQAQRPLHWNDKKNGYKMSGWKKP